MNGGPIVDAGPALNFFASRHERLLFASIGGICIPEAVRDEIRNKAKSDQRFAPAERVASTLQGRLLTVLPDEETDELNQVIHRLERMPMRERMKQRRDLGETMVIAHAVVAAQAGADVWILIDEVRGSRVAAAEKRRLERRREEGEAAGSLHIINTLTVLEKAVRLGEVPDRGAMRKIYGQLRELDDGLVAIEQTSLLDKKLWQRSTEI
jgi:hypothetical protein